MFVGLSEMSNGVEKKDCFHQKQYSIYCISFKN